MFSKMRAPNGSMVDNPTFSTAPPPWSEYRRNISERMPGVMHWYFSDAGRRTMRRIEKGFLYSIVLPTDTRDTKRERVNRKYFLKQTKAALFQFSPHKLLVQTAIHAMAKRAKRKIDDAQIKFDLQRMLTGSDAERKEMLNLTDAEYQAIHAHMPNLTARYLYAELLAPPFERHFKRFQPSPHYGGRYYDNPELRRLPPPTLPAPVYPWPWRHHLDAIRAMLLPIMDMLRQELAQEEAKFQAEEAARFAQDQVEIEAQRIALRQAHDAKLADAVENDSWVDNLFTGQMGKPPGLLGDRRLQDRVWDAWANGGTQDTPLPTTTTAAMAVAVAPTPTATSSRSAASDPSSKSIDDSRRGTSSSKSGLGSSSEEEDEDEEEEEEEDDEEDEDEVATPIESERMRLARRLIEEHASRFHFITGIPRLVELQDHFLVVPFPSPSEVTQFHLNLTIRLARDFFDPLQRVTGDGWRHPEDHNSSADDSSLADGSSFGGRDYGNATTPLPPGVYDAMQFFYAFPVVRDERMLESNGKYAELLGALAPNDSARAAASAQPEFVGADPSAQLTFARCSIASPCLARSGVTVFTPALRSLHFFANASNGIDSPERQRANRLFWLRAMVDEASVAERRALQLGLQAPSSVKYSKHDTQMDAMADALMGFIITATEKSAARAESHTPRAYHVFRDLLAEDWAIPFRERSPLFADGVYIIKSMLQRDRDVRGGRGVPELAAFSDAELKSLIAVMWAHMQHLTRVADAYNATRAADPTFQAAQAADDKLLPLEKRPFGLLRFGYYLPPFNEELVGLRVHPPPMPFHLMTRLIVRFQEADLLLRSEIRLLLACLAMLQSELPYDRCVDNSTMSDSSSSFSSFSSSSSSSFLRD
ncbi:hypothetical protein P43SY_007444 [Pythium insidiosum]|uniref:Uncharacterized protein n=1 Tax=Pythium insidiosum TaxID=114742 RepID=A0AAD5Q606_PYTIN|nr:hypothetical protein P43SY_007444 [Pythium insidiosum]